MYLSWAQYPITETEQLENYPGASAANARAAYVVRFRDLRYDYPGRNGRATLGAIVLLNRNLEEVDERFGMGSNNPK